MRSFMTRILAPRYYLTFCFIFFCIMAIFRHLHGFPFWVSIRQLAIFLVLLAGIACNIRLARKVTAVVHIYYAIPSVPALAALIYHGGAMDVLGYELATIPAALLTVLVNGYFILGAIRLWRVK